MLASGENSAQYSIVICHATMMIDVVKYLKEYFEFVKSQKKLCVRKQWIPGPGPEYEVYIFIPRP